MVTMAMDLPLQKIYGVDGCLAASNLHAAGLQVVDGNSIDHSIVFIKPSVSPWSPPNNQVQFDAIESTTQMVLSNLANPIVIRGTPQFEPPRTHNGTPVNKFEEIVLQKNGDPSGLVKVQFVDAYDGTPTNCQPMSTTTIFAGFDSLSDWQKQNWAGSRLEVHPSRRCLYTISRRQFIEYGKHELSGGLKMLASTTSRPSKPVEWLRRYAMSYLHRCNPI